MATLDIFEAFGNAMASQGSRDFSYQVRTQKETRSLRTTISDEKITVRI